MCRFDRGRYSCDLGRLRLNVVEIVANWRSREAHLTFIFQMSLRGYVRIRNNWHTTCRICEHY